MCILLDYIYITGTNISANLSKYDPNTHRHVHINTINKYVHWRHYAGDKPHNTSSVGGIMGLMPVAYGKKVKPSHYRPGEAQRVPGG